MLLLMLLLVAPFTADSQPEWIAPGPAVARGPEPRWIWVGPKDGSAPTARNAAPGTVWLVRQFDAPEGIRSARLMLAADNSAAAYLNGARVLGAKDWSAPVSAKVEVLPGNNVLAIEAENGTIPGADPATAVNPAGVIARLDMTLNDGSMQWLMTDGSWHGATEKWSEFPAAPRDPDACRPAVDLGPASTKPWSLSAGVFEPARPCPLMRRTFSLDVLPAAATVRIIGLGHYELRCNGERVSNARFNQVWSQYDKTLYWQEFNLQPHLRRGENVLAVALGNSFWQVAPANDSGRFTKTDAMPDFANGWPHLLWLDAKITPVGENPLPVRIVSDAAWKWTMGPVTFSNLYAGEDYDARLAKPGWDAPEYDDSGWNAPTIAPAPAGTPTKLVGPPMKAYDVFKPREVRAVDVDAAIYTYVFPQNCSALLRFTLDGGAAGARVRFRPCEYMEPGGRVKFTYTWGTGKDIWLDYTKATAGEETHEPLFFYVGAQFVQVEGAVPPDAPNPRSLPVLKSLELVHVRAACPEVGHFDADAPMHDAAHAIIDWAIRSNMAHVPTDCPHREKNGWQEQTWHMARALSYRYDIHDWFVRNCRAIRDAQTAGGPDDGFVPTNTPWYLVGRPRHDMYNDSTEWGVSSVLVPWHLYEWYGDRDTLTASFDSARRFVDYLGTTASDGIIRSNLGDWYDFGHGKGNGPSQWTPNEVSATAIWAYGADTVAKMAEVLGRKEDAAKYRSLFERVRADFQRRFYDSATHTVKNNGSCQAGTSAALCIGLIPDGDRAAALDAIVADLEARGWKQTPGEVLQIFLIRALAENGRGDVLHRIYNRDDIPSYGHMVRSGLTTLPESWDARRGTGDSLNHFMLGHLMEWHFAYVAGIRQQPGSVGWTKVLIAPQLPPAADKSPHAIHEAGALFHSPRGRIGSQWEIDSTKGEFRLTCLIPAGVEAVAVMPDGTRHDLPPGNTVLTQPRPK
ncbi:MAG: family 78 glycoside hydrolase catalytic domain [Phycisphaerales bacterium]|nr:family 78 glycoside hydrolase catalytic domain [Phycisphaerales bacterium]